MSIKQRHLEDAVFEALFEKVTINEVVCDAKKAFKLITGQNISTPAMIRKLMAPLTKREFSIGAVVTRSLDYVAKEKIESMQKNTKKDMYKLVNFFLSKDQSFYGGDELVSMMQARLSYGLFAEMLFCWLDNSKQLFPSLKKLDEMKYHDFKNDNTETGYDDAVAALIAAAVTSAVFDLIENSQMALLARKIVHVLFQQLNITYKECAAIIYGKQNIYDKNLTFDLAKKFFEKGLGRFELQVGILGVAQSYIPELSQHIPRKLFAIIDPVHYIMMGSTANAGFIGNTNVGFLLIEERRKEIAKFFNEIEKKKLKINVKRIGKIVADLEKRKKMRLKQYIVNMTAGFGMSYCANAKFIKDFGKSID